MARPQKKGLDYFPFDIELDIKWDLLEAEFGLTGFAIAVKLYQRIYKNGYYWNVTEDELLLTSKRVNVDINLINDIINKMIVRNFFNSKIYKKHSILTSEGIQKRYFEATKRRDNVDIHKELLLTETPVNVTLTSLNAHNNPQRKEKKRKEKKRVFVPPSFDEVLQYFSKEGYTEESAERFFKGYDVNEWRDSTDKPIKNWKMKAQQVWFKDENKIKNKPASHDNAIIENKFNEIIQMVKSGATWDNIKQVVNEFQEKSFPEAQILISQLEKEKCILSLREGKNECS